jgi:hypothetical protein
MASSGGGREGSAAIDAIQATPTHPKKETMTNQSEALGRQDLKVDSDALS